MAEKVSNTIPTHTTVTFNPTNNDSVRLSDLPREQKDTTQKTISAAAASIPSKYPTLPMRQAVSIDPCDLSMAPAKRAAAQAGIAPTPTENQAIERLAETKRSLDQEIERAENKGDKPRANYLIQMSKLVAEISLLLHQMNSRDSRRIEEKKKKYHVSSNEIVGNMGTKGKITGASAVVGFIVPLLAGFLTGGDKFTTDQVTGLVNIAKELISVPYDQGTQKASALNQLIIQELQKLNEASSSNNNLRDQGLQVLNEIKQWLQKSVSHGG